MAWASTGSEPEGETVRGCELKEGAYGEPAMLRAGLELACVLVPGITRDVGWLFAAPCSGGTPRARTDTPSPRRRRSRERGRSAWPGRSTRWVTGPGYWVDRGQRAPAPRGTVRAAARPRLGPEGDGGDGGAPAGPPTPSRPAPALRGAAPTDAETEFVVAGFHCTSCAQAVERALVRRPGIRRAQATFATETIRVGYDPAVTGVPEIQRVMGAVGFRAYTQAEAANLRVSPQQRDLQRRLRRTRLGWALGGPVFVAMVYGWAHPLPAGTVWVMAALTTALQVLLGRVFYSAAWRALRHARAVTTDVLVSLGAGSSYLFSVAGLLLGWRPLFFDTSAMVVVLITQGNYACP